MRRNVSQQESTVRADDTLRALVRMLAHAAAREVLMATPRTEESGHGAPPPSEGDNDVK